ncbi:BadF/BadG/BcrA/BcrD ATPase family protein [Peribacillus sp. SCS-155]|uniref:BadF/BadG/BcrA/BcrD ATPase family protein n=1 Tax=Peribacillus sedimenti TaxID=3115297 RepID=UPI003906A46A
MRFVAVDCGQTKSEVTVFEKRGKIRTWFEKPVLHPAAEGGMECLGYIVTNVLTELVLDGVQNINICFSLSGFHGEHEIVQYIRNIVDKILPEVSNVWIIPDYLGNWFSVTGGNPGMVIISGGGTIAYGENGKGEKRRLGGWGHLLGDEGSGYWFGLQTIKAVLRSINGLTPPTMLVESVKERLGTSDEFEIAHLLYSGRISDADIALITPSMIQSAEKGDVIAKEILKKGVAHLVELAENMTRQLGTIPIHASGGVFRSPFIQIEFNKQMETKGLIRPSIKAVKPEEGILRYMKTNIVD